MKTDEPCVTQDLNAFLDTPFTESEICIVVFDFSPLKSSGSNSFTAAFFSKMLRYCEGGFGALLVGDS